MRARRSGPCYGGPVKTATTRRDQREGRRPGGHRGTGPPSVAFDWIGAAVGVGSVFLGTFLLYFLVYRVRHFSLPMGWDTPWYVWRADYVGHVGIGPLDTNARPGHALLSATLSSLTGLSALRMEVVLPFVLVAMLALAVGAVAAVGTGRQEWWRWAAAAAGAGVTRGTTRRGGGKAADLLEGRFGVVAFLLPVRGGGGGRGGGGAGL